MGCRSEGFAMLNILLSALGLPKRVENTPQTPALRRIAGLEELVEDLQAQVDSLMTNALEQGQRIDALVKAMRKANRNASPNASPKASPKTTTKGRKP